MTQVQNQPLAAADPAPFTSPAPQVNGAATFGGLAAPSRADAVAGTRWPLPNRVLPEPTPDDGPGPQARPGSVAGIFDSLIDQLGAMLQNMFGGGSPGPTGGGNPDPDGTPGSRRVPTGDRQI